MYVCTGKAVKAGVTTDEIDRIVYEACLERWVFLPSYLPTYLLDLHTYLPPYLPTVPTYRDAYPSPLNYYKFPKSVCTSVNEVGR